MGVKSKLGKIYATAAVKKIKKWAERPIETQQKVFRELIEKASATAFGKDHNFSSITTYEDFKKAVPIRDYEDLKPYIDKVRKGEKTYSGRANQYTSVKLLALLLARNTSRFRRNQSRTILIVLVMLYFAI